MNLFKALELRKQVWDFADVSSQSLCHKNGEIDKHIFVKVIQRSNVDSRPLRGLYFASELLSRNLLYQCHKWLLSLTYQGESGYLKRCCKRDDSTKPAL